MKVLHVYSSDHPRLPRYVGLLMQAMPADVDGVSADSAAAVRQAIRDFQPDIIHQHGQPLAFTRSEARLVVSPHGETVDTAEAFAVVVRSPYELTCHANERKVLVRDPLITKTIDFPQAAAAIHAVYQRVVDSHPLEHMDSRTRHLLALLLKSGLLGDRGWVADDRQWTAWQTAHSGAGVSLTDFDFRRLAIYAVLEGVDDLVRRGLDLLGLGSPAWPTVDCYLPAGYQTPAASPPAAGAAHDTLAALLDEAASHGVTLRRLTEMTGCLYDDGLDEARLMDRLDAEKQRPFFQSVLQLLAEKTLLTEGFMPCAPADNALTQELRNQIEKHLRIS